MNGSTFLERLGVSLPVLAAPMAGGPTTPALVLAAAGSGSLGFLAAGYQQAQTLAVQVAGVAAETDAYGVNLFAPHPVPVDPLAYAAYREALRPLGERLGVDLPELPVEDDDHWHDKVDVLVAAAPRVVSFTFGLPDPATVAALHGSGSLLAQTVTTADEARQAAEAGLDALVVQAPVGRRTLRDLHPRAAPGRAVTARPGGRDRRRDVAPGRRRRRGGPPRARRGSAGGGRGCSRRGHRLAARAGGGHGTRQPRRAHRDLAGRHEAHQGVHGAAGARRTQRLHGPVRRRPRRSATPRCTT